MGTMRLTELSVAGKIFIALLFIGLLWFGVSADKTRRFNKQVDAGNVQLGTGNYDAAITCYNSALRIKSSESSKIKSLIYNATTLKDAEINKLVQEITSIIGDKYAGIEGSNSIAIKRGHYAAVEIESTQNKIERLKALNYDTQKVAQFQRILDTQKTQVINRRR